MDEFLKAMAALVFALSALIITRLTLWIKEKIDERKRLRLEEAARKERHTIRFSALIHERVKNVENRIMKIYRPVRMFVFHYYNGKVNAANMPVLKIIASHEVTLYPEVKYLTESYQGRPIPEKFYEGILEAFTKGHYEYSLAQCDANPPLRDFFETWDICSMLFVGIRNDAGEPAATLVMQWPGDKIPINRAEINKIKADKIKIENIYAGRD